MTAATRENCNVLANLNAMNSQWHLKFWDFRSKGNIRKTKGAASNDSSDTSDKDYVIDKLQKDVSKQVKQTLLLNKKCFLKDDLLKAFYDQEKHIEEISVLKKNQK